MRILWIWQPVTHQAISIRELGFKSGTERFVPLAFSPFRRAPPKLPQAGIESGGGGSGRRGIGGGGGGDGGGGGGAQIDYLQGQLARQQEQLQRQQGDNVIDRELNNLRRQYDHDRANLQNEYQNARHEVDREIIGARAQMGVEQHANALNIERDRERAIAEDERAALEAERNRNQQENVELNEENAEILRRGRERLARLDAAINRVEAAVDEPMEAEDIDDELDNAEDRALRLRFRLFRHDVPHDDPAAAVRPELAARLGPPVRPQAPAPAIQPIRPAIQPIAGQAFDRMRREVRGEVEEYQPQREYMDEVEFNRIMNQRIAQRTTRPNVQPNMAPQVGNMAPEMMARPEQRRQRRQNLEPPNFLDPPDIEGFTREELAGLTIRRDELAARMAEHEPGVGEREEFRNRVEDVGARLGVEPIPVATDALRLEVYNHFITELSQFLDGTTDDVDPRLRVRLEQFRNLERQYNEALRSKVDELAGELHAQYQQTLSNFGLERDAALAEINRLREVNAAMEVDRNERASQVLELADQLRTVTHAGETHIAGLERQINDLRNEAGNNVDRIQELEAEASLLRINQQSKIGELQSQLAEVTTSVMEKTRQLEIQQNDQERQRLAHRDEVAKLHADNVAQLAWANDMILKAETEQTSLREKLSRAKNANGRERQKLIDELKEVTEHLENTKSILQEATSQNDQLKAALEASEVLEHNLSEELERKNTRIERLLKDRGEAMRTLAERTQEKDILADSLAAQYEYIEKLKQDQNSQTKEFKRLIKDLENAMAASEKDVKIKELQIKELQRDIVEAKNLKTDQSANRGSATRALKKRLVALRKEKEAIVAAALKKETELLEQLSVETTRANEAERALSAVTKTLNKLRREFTEYQEKTAETVADYKRQQVALMNQVATITAASAGSSKKSNAELESLREAIEVLQAQQRALVDENTAVYERMKADQTRVKVIEKDLLATREQLHENELELQVAESRRTSAERRVIYRDEQVLQVLGETATPERLELTRNQLRTLYIPKNPTALSKKLYNDAVKMSHDPNLNIISAEILMEAYDTEIGKAWKVPMTIMQRELQNSISALEKSRAVRKEAIEKKKSLGRITTKPQISQRTTTPPVSVEVPPVKSAAPKAVEVTKPVKPKSPSKLTTRDTGKMVADKKFVSSVRLDAANEARREKQAEKLLKIRQVEVPEMETDTEDQDTESDEYQSSFVDDEDLEELEEENPAEMARSLRERAKKLESDTSMPEYKRRSEIKRLREMADNLYTEDKVLTKLDTKSYTKSKESSNSKGISKGSLYKNLRLKRLVEAMIRQKVELRKLNRLVKAGKENSDTKDRINALTHTLRGEDRSLRALATNPQRFLDYISAGVKTMLGSMFATLPDVPMDTDEPTIVVSGNNNQINVNSDKANAGTPKVAAQQPNSQAPLPAAQPSQPPQPVAQPIAIRRRVPLMPAPAMPSVPEETPTPVEQPSVPPQAQELQRRLEDLRYIY